MEDLAYTSGDLLFGVMLAWFILWCFRTGIRDGGSR